MLPMLRFAQKKDRRSTEVPRQSLCRVYFKLEGVSETEIGLNEVV
jgi:hypothetical protein